jgi:hypothetical protein
LIEDIILKAPSQKVEDDAEAGEKECKKYHHMFHIFVNEYKNCCQYYNNFVPG